MAGLKPDKATSKEDLLKAYFSGGTTTIVIDGENVQIEAIHPIIGCVSATVECSDGRVFELEGPADDEHMHLME